MKLITEEVSKVKFIVEGKGDKKKMFIEGVFLQGEIKNRNGRMYPISTLAKEVGRYNESFVTKGASTVITLSEGMGNPFKVDDVLTISGVTGVTGFNTTARVVSIQEARTIGYAQFGAKLTVDHDSRALNSDNAVTTAAEARRTLTVAARTDSGSGKMYVQQVQTSGIA